MTDGARIQRDNYSRALARARSGGFHEVPRLFISFKVYTRGERALFCICSTGRRLEIVAIDPRVDVIDNFDVCAHIYVYMTSGIGRCVLRGNDDDYDNGVESGRNKAIKISAGWFTSGNGALLSGECIPGDDWPLCTRARGRRGGRDVRP